MGWRLLILRQSPVMATGVPRISVNPWEARMLRLFLFTLISNYSTSHLNICPSHNYKNDEAQKYQRGKERGPGCWDFSDAGRRCMAQWRVNEWYARGLRLSSRSAIDPLQARKKTHSFSGFSFLIGKIKQKDYTGMFWCLFGSQMLWFWANPFPLLFTDQNALHSIISQQKN